MTDNRLIISSWAWWLSGRGETRGAGVGNLPYQYGIRYAHMSTCHSGRALVEARPLPPVVVAVRLGCGPEQPHSKPRARYWFPLVGKSDGGGEMAYFRLHSPVHFSVALAFLASVAAVTVQEFPSMAELS